MENRKDLDGDDRRKETRKCQGEETTNTKAERQGNGMCSGWKFRGNLHCMTGNGEDGKAHWDRSWRSCTLPSSPLLNSHDIIFLGDALTLFPAKRHIPPLHPATSCLHPLLSAASALACRTPSQGRVDSSTPSGDELYSVPLRSASSLWIPRVQG